jgi:hypothetical protein
MTSAFDSEVYAERQRLPGVTVSLPRVMKAALWSGGGNPVKEVTLTVEYRPDVLRCWPRRERWRRRQRAHKKSDRWRFSEHPRSLSGNGHSRERGAGKRLRPRGGCPPQAAVSGLQSRSPGCVPTRILPAHAIRRKRADGGGSGGG